MMLNKGKKESVFMSMTDNLSTRGSSCIGIRSVPCVLLEVYL